ncbi:MAG: lipopolysaccharide biosynthesis protein [Candidatus Heimdallarchaeota archaeon]|nr:lipopolysaccharide biosynthesis protein [Candidatus Heimdallarchaeota archaeon]
MNIPRILFGKVKNLILPSDKLAQQASRSVIWSLTARIINQVLSLVKMAIIAEILGPKAFGIIGIALIVLSLLNTVSQTGLSYALIHEQENIHKYLNTAWTIKIIRNLLLYLILYLTAPFVAIFFNEPSSEIIIKVVGSILLVDAFTNIGTVFFQKDLNYHKSFIYQISGGLISFIISIILTFIWGNVWVLVIAYLSEYLIKFILSYVLQPFRPRIEFDKEKFKHLLNYSKWIFLSGIMSYVILEGDDIMVGFLVGTIGLGLYRMAYKLANLVTTQISHVIASISMPVYSKMQNNIVKTRETYLMTLKLTSFIIIPFNIMVFTLAYDVTLLVFGAEWLPMVLSMKILSIAGIIRGLSTTSGPIFLAIGKPKLNVRWQILRFMIIVILIIPFIEKWGLEGASWVVLLSIFISNFGFTYNAVNYLKCGYRIYLKSVFIPTFLSSITGYCIILLIAIFPISSYLSLFFYILISIVIYFILSFIADKYFNYGIIDLIKTSLNMI